MSNSDQTPVEKSATSASSNSAESAGRFESLGRKVDQRPEVQMAEAAVAAARTELEQAQQFAAEVRQRAQQNVDGLREKNVGDLIAATLHQVSKRPALGVGVAFVVGMVFGRITRR